MEGTERCFLGVVCENEQQFLEYGKEWFLDVDVKEKSILGERVGPCG